METRLSSLLGEGQEAKLKTAILTACVWILEIAAVLGIATTALGMIILLGSHRVDSEVEIMPVAGVSIALASLLVSNALQSVIKRMEP